jgi:hypothetical protein
MWSTTVGGRSEMKNIELVRQRSGGNCEAMIWVESAEVWSRCGGRPVEVHHVLPRSRGGTILDAVGETYHLIATCNRCHTEAHTGQMMIDGYVTGKTGRPVYHGTDEYLLTKYPEEG